MERSYFITGGTGFIGRALVKSLLENPGKQPVAKVVLLTRDPDSFRKRAPALASHKKVDLLRGDVVHFTFPTGKFTDVIHAAAESNDLRVADRPAYYLGLVEGARRVLDFSVKCGCERFLLLSSGAVYGHFDQLETGIPEDWGGAPAILDVNSAYGHAKRAAEHLCALYREQYGLAAKIARLFAVIGEGLPLDGQYAVGNFLRDALDPSKSEIRIEGDGTPIRSFLYLGDVGTWLLKILDDGRPCYPYNVGSEAKVSIRELAEMVAAAVAPGKKIVISRGQRDYEGRSYYVPDCRRAKAELGLRETVSLDEAIRKVAAERTGA
jgi:dTDP-glucose 4,6-dehydratase